MISMDKSTDQKRVNLLQREIFFSENTNYPILLCFSPLTKYKLPLPVLVKAETSVLKIESKVDSTMQ